MICLALINSFVCISVFGCNRDRYFAPMKTNKHTVWYVLPYFKRFHASFRSVEWIQLKSNIFIQMHIGIRNIGSSNCTTNCFVTIFNSISTKFQCENYVEADTSTALVLHIQVVVYLHLCEILFKRIQNIFKLLRYFADDFMWSISFMVLQAMSFMIRSISFKTFHLTWLE